MHTFVQANMDLLYSTYADALIWISVGISYVFVVCVGCVDVFTRRFI